MTVELLKLLNNLTGSYGIAIIVLTIIVRAALWPLGLSQQRSMRAMQVLQPKMKIIQERYKSDPQMMQRKMMEFYKEHKFNPMAGCLPLLIQMPIFILLYAALISPQFIQEAGNSHFLFIKRLDTTLRGSAGNSYDGEFSVSSGDRFVIYKKVKVFLDDKEIEDVKLQKDALQIQGSVTAGKPVEFKIKDDNFKSLSFEEIDKMSSAEIEIQDMKTREVENVKFERRGDMMIASVPTVEPQSQFHTDVLILVILFAASMFITQKVMMSSNKNTQQDPMQAQMQQMMGNIMPIFIIFMFVTVPIPAGVLLYMVVSNIFQIIQTIVINRQLQIEEDKKTIYQETKE